MKSEAIIVNPRMARNFLNTRETERKYKPSKEIIARMKKMLIEKKYVPVICFDKKGVLFNGESALQCIVNGKLTCKCLVRYDMDNKVIELGQVKRIKPEVPYIQDEKGNGFVKKYIKEHGSPKSFGWFKTNCGELKYSVPTDVWFDDNDIVQKDVLWYYEGVSK